MNAVRFTSMLALLLFAMTGCQTYQSQNRVAVDQPGVQDQIFLLEAFASGVKEIEMGRIGIDRARDLDVRLLAQRIYDDHTAAQEALALLAYRKNIALPIDQRFDRSDVEHLSNIPDEQFDMAYLNHMLQAHHRDITKYEASARTAQSEDVRTFAATTLPALREHQRLAQNIRELVAVQMDISREAAGAEPNAPRADPYYRGGSQRHHQFDNLSGR